MSTHPRVWFGALLVGSLTLPAPLMAQGLGQIPINGFNATFALEETVDKFYSDVNKTLEVIGDGFDNRATPTFHSDAGSLETLQTGTAVAVHYMVKGIQASADEINGSGPDSLRLNEGIVTKVDRSRKRITITFADGTAETLRLTQHPASGGRVIVYYPDGSGRRVAHYFKPTES